MSTNLHTCIAHQWLSRHSHTPVCMLVTSTANMSTRVTTKHLDGESLDSWATSSNLGLLYKPKETPSFSHRWNVGTNPDLACASFGQDSRLLDIRVLGKFPLSQHWPSLITPLKLQVPDHSNPVKRLNFRKTDWRHFCLLTDESVERLPPPDTSNIERAHQDFCESLLSAAR